MNVKHCAAEVWLVGPAAGDLDKNNLASSQLLIFQSVAETLVAGVVLEKNNVLVRSPRSAYNGIYRYLRRIRSAKSTPFTLSRNGHSAKSPAIRAFDGNRYCVPPRYVGRKLTVKVDAASITIYAQHQGIVRYARCWERGQTFGSERFQKELFAQMAAAQRSDAQQRLVALLGPESAHYLPGWPIPIAFFRDRCASCSRFTNMGPMPCRKQ